MVHSWNYALAMLLASSTTNPVASFQSNNNLYSIQTAAKHNRRNHHDTLRSRRRSIAAAASVRGTTKSSLTSMAADASSAFNNKDNNKDANLGEALSSVTNAAVDSIANAVKDEPDTDAEEIERKQKMMQRRQTEKTYKVTLPISPSTEDSNLGIRLCQISKGRKLDSVLELSLDTLELEDAAKRGAIASSDDNTSTGIFRSPDSSRRQQTIGHGCENAYK